jgi:3-dehydroquinate dehydratase II
VNKSDVLIIHGPNLNYLGVREKGFYGDKSLQEVNDYILMGTEEIGFNVHFFQSNLEGEIVSVIQEASQKYIGIILNPAGFGYSSIAIRDALLLTSIPVIEVHLSNIHARESFRYHTLTSSACIGVICGFQASSYILALHALKRHITG